MSKGGTARGLWITNSKTQNQCKDCLIGKMKAKPFADHTSNVKHVLARVHCDLAGPINVQSLGGANYAHFLIDKYSCYTFASFVARKSNVPYSADFVIQHTENETGLKLSELQSDNGTEIVNKDMQIVLDYNATTHQTSVPYTPQQDRIAE